MPGDRQETSRLLAADIRRDAPLHVAMAFYCAIVGGILVATDAGLVLSYWSYAPVWTSAFFFVFPMLYLTNRAFWVVHRVDRRRRLAWHAVFTPPRVATFVSGLLLLFSLMLFQGAFTSFKSAMPLWWGGFPFDPLQADIDRTIHFGADPWTYLFALFDAPWFQRVVEINYSLLWFVFCFGLLFWFTVVPRHRESRTRYLASYMATWIIVGNVIACLWLSAGPAFYDRVTGDELRFSAQMALLARTGDALHSAHAFQVYLWDVYAGDGHAIGSGISAFPSMHVALVTLNVLFIAEMSRRWAIVGLVYLAIISLSSVYLAWHYAIDAYAAIALTSAVYVAMRRLFGRAAERRHSNTLAATAS